MRPLSVGGRQLLSELGLCRLQRRRLRPALVAAGSRIINGLARGVVPQPLLELSSFFVHRVDFSDRKWGFYSHVTPYRRGVTPPIGRVITLGTKRQGQGRQEARLERQGSPQQNQQESGGPGRHSGQPVPPARRHWIRHS